MNIINQSNKTEVLRGFPSSHLEEHVNLYHSCITVENCLCKLELYLIIRAPNFV